MAQYANELEFNEQEAKEIELHYLWQSYSSPVVQKEIEKRLNGVIFENKDQKWDVEQNLRWEMFRDEAVRKGLIRFRLSPREEQMLDEAIQKEQDRIDFQYPSSPPDWAKYDKH